MWLFFDPPEWSISQSWKFFSTVVFHLSSLWTNIHILPMQAEDFFLAYFECTALLSRSHKFLSLVLCICNILESHLHPASFACYFHGDIKFSCGTSSLTICMWVEFIVSFSRHFTHNKFCSIAILFFSRAILILRTKDTSLLPSACGLKMCVWIEYIVLILVFMTNVQL